MASTKINLNMVEGITEALGTTISDATAKAIPVSADTIPLSDSAASNVLKKITWTNLLDRIKVYTDTLYLSKTGQASVSDLMLTGAAGTVRSFKLASASVSRFKIGLGSGAESGGNSGSTFVLWRCDDAGNDIDTPFLVDRPTGIPTLRGTEVKVMNSAAATSQQVTRIIAESSTGTAIMSLDPGNNGYNVRDFSIRATNNGGNQITASFYTANGSTPAKAFDILPSTVTNFTQRPTWNGVGLATTAEASGGGGGAGVTSFNGRNGVVSATTNDYSAAQVSYGGGVVSTYLDQLSLKTTTIVTPEMYGAFGNGSTDDTTAIQNALNAINAAGGGLLLLGNGKRYLISNVSIASGHAAISIIGVGVGSNNTNCSAFVLTSGGTGNGLTFGDTASGSSGIRLQNFRIDGNGRNNGFCIRLAREVGTEIKNVRVVNCYNGFECYGFNNIQFEDCVIAGGTGTQGFYMWGDDTNRFNVCTLYSCGVSQSGTKTMSAYTVDGAGGTITLIDCIAVTCGYGLRAQNTKGTSDGISFIWAYAFQTDFALNDGIRLENVKGVYLTGTYSHGSESGRGITALSDCMALQISGGKITGNYSDGIYFAGTDMTLGGGIGIEGNGLIGSNVRDGVVIAATAKNVIISGSKLGRYANLSSSQRYGVIITAGATGILVTGNDLTGNLTSGVQNNAGAGATIATNLT